MAPLHTTVTLATAELSSGGEATAKAPRKVTITTLGEAVEALRVMAAATPTSVVPKGLEARVASHFTMVRENGRSSSTLKTRSFILCLHRPGSHVAYAYACACVRRTCKPA